MDVSSVLNYALQQNGAALVREIYLKNKTGTDLENLIVRVSSDVDLVEPFTQGIQVLTHGDEIRIKTPAIHVKGEYLASLTERVFCNLQIEVCRGEECLVSEIKPLTVLAYDEWPVPVPEPLLAYFSPQRVQV